MVILEYGYRSQWDTEYEITFFELFKDTKQNSGPGEYQIFVKVEDTRGNADTPSIWVYVSVGVKETDTSGVLSEAFSLSQTYLNPFNPETELSLYSSCTFFC
jgi:hypothetical protein